MRRNEIFTNRLGLDIPIEVMYVEKSDDGKILNDWYMDAYNCAKIILYKDAISLLPINEEAVQIGTILSMGIQQYLDFEKGGADASA